MHNGFLSSPLVERQGYLTWVFPLCLPTPPYNLSMIPCTMTFPHPLQQHIFVWTYKSSFDNWMILKAEYQGNHLLWPWGIMACTAKLYMISAFHIFVFLHFFFPSLPFLKSPISSALALLWIFCPHQILTFQDLKDTANVWMLLFPLVSFIEPSLELILPRSAS